MIRRLFILRHAKSAWDTDASSDFERPLAKRGKKDVPAVGAWMLEQGLLPDHIISSPAERAKQTVIGICHALDIEKKAIHWDSRVYGADTEELLELLSEVPDNAKAVLIVGHNPGLESLFSYLSSTDNDEVGVVKTATLVHLEMDAAWNALKPQCATLIAVKSPRELSPSSE